MEIDANILSDFFKKVTLDTKISKARLITNTDGMHTRLNLVGHLVTEGILIKNAFHKFEENVTLDIRDTTRFKKILNSFKDKLNVSVEDVNIIMKGVNKTAHFKLASEIDTFQENASKVVWDNGVDVPMTFIKEIVTNINNVECDNVELEVKNKKLIATTQGQEDTIVEELNVDYKNCKFTIAADYFTRIVNVMDSESINLSFQDLVLQDKNPPLRIMEKGKVHKFSVWIAPFRKDV